MSWLADVRTMTVGDWEVFTALRGCTDKTLLQKNLEIDEGELTWSKMIDRAKAYESQVDIVKEINKEAAGRSTRGRGESIRRTTDYLCWRCFKECHFSMHCRTPVSELKCLTCPKEVFAEQPHNQSDRCKKIKTQHKKKEKKEKKEKVKKLSDSESKESQIKKKKKKKEKENTSSSKFNNRNKWNRIRSIWRRKCQ